MSAPSTDTENVTSPGEQAWALGIDLSLTSTGVAVVDIDTGETHTQRIRSRGSKDDRLPENITRINALVAEIMDACNAARPKIVVIESALFSTHNDSSAHRRAGLWWAVVRELYAQGYFIVEVAPAQLKRYATGKGTASKTAMAHRAAAVFGEEVTECQDDRVDAAFLAVMGAHVYGGAVPPGTVNATADREATAARLREVVVNPAGSW